LTSNEVVDPILEVVDLRYAGYLCLVEFLFGTMLVKVPAVHGGEAPLGHCGGAITYP
jgi:hypothetical protein